MSAEIVYAADDIWVNIGNGNIEYITTDPPMLGFEKQARVRVQFRSGASKLMPEGLSIEVVVGRLNGFSVTDLGSRNFWCDGNVEQKAPTQAQCPKTTEGTAHGPHGIHT